MKGVEVESLHTLQKQQTINKRKELYYTGMHVFYKGFVRVKINTCPHIPWDLLVVGIQLNFQGMCTSLDDVYIIVSTGSTRRTYLVSI